MKNDFIYDLMRSEEIREYYRKNIDLTIEEQEIVIINCFKSIKEKLELLKKLHDNVSDTDKQNIKEMVTLYELVNTIYYNPYEFFGKEYRVIYVLHYLTFECDIVGVENAVLDCGLFHHYSNNIEYFDNLEKMTEFMDESECYKYHDPIIVDMIVIPLNGEESHYHINFTCQNINGDIEPSMFSLDSKTIIFNQYDISGAFERYNLYFRYKGMPFKTGDRIKFQLPFMSEPFYGIISCEQDYPIDPNSYWYNFVYKDGTKVEEFDKVPILFDMSYTNIKLTSGYAIFDWLERA